MHSEQAKSREVFVRPAKLEDFEACLRLRAYMGERYELEPHDPEAQAIFAMYVKGEHKIALVAELDSGDIIGCLRVASHTCRFKFPFRAAGRIRSPLV